ncbi:DJ-1/PfpI family protein [Brumimicrobium oceani]|uniref:DJ-1 family protein n=1 Tax=Brumimicrobium oceani TaxID=2100725 RepID=A0A2U2XC74_9FLAO|nr:DJ-1/PfpI family protein [Brumimicrobium oceani]PWH85392.1 DJ-1 family protein [Brumimicrobium oceani]
MKKVLLVLAEGFELLEASAFIDVIGWNLEEGNGRTQLFTCGLKKEIKSTFNQTFIADFLIDEIDVNAYDALAIPGGFEQYGFYKDAYGEKIQNLIRSFHSKDKIIASICVGALPLGKSGILKGKNATTYGNPDRRKSLEDFGAHVVNEQIVADNRIITSHGPSTALEVAFLLLENLTTKQNTNQVKKLMGF